MIRIANPKPAPTCLFTYSGRECDSETELPSEPARHYDPTVGRFLGEEPAGCEVGNADLYRYAGNRPE